MHVRADGGFAPADDLSDFSVGKSVPVSQHQDGSLLIRQLGYGHRD